MSNYIPLNIHTEYSLMESTIRVSELINYAKENNIPAIAITDYGVMYSAIEFYEVAKMAGIKPLIGCELFVHNGDIKEQETNDSRAYNIVLIAKNQQGYKNLMKLCTNAWYNKFYDKHCINFELLKECHDGLICTSGCLDGVVQRYLLTQGKEMAIESAKRYKDLFGDDYYIGLQDNGIKEQKLIHSDLIKIARELDIGMIITNDSHYLKKEDSDTCDSLLCIKTHAYKSDDEFTREYFPNQEFYVKSKKEMREAFSWMDDVLFEECCANTENIAKKCNVEIELHNANLPKFNVPENYNSETYLKYLVMKGLEKRYGKNLSDDIIERANYELGIVNDNGYTDYFLIVWDIVQYAKKHNISIGTARGSAGSSLINYALEITEIDPIKYDLIFERFLNPENPKLPDIDMDLCIEKRYKIIDYIKEKYGNDRVCKIMTLYRYRSMNAIKATGKIFKIPDDMIYVLSKELEYGVYGNLKNIILYDKNSKLKELYDEDYIFTSSDGEKISFRNWIDNAIKIDNIAKNVGTHATGIIIADKPLDNYMPLQNSREGDLQTGYPNAAEKFNLLKLDFLGLRILTSIDRTLDLINKQQNVDIAINEIPLDDENIFKMLVAGDTKDIFQFESERMQDYIKRLKPDKFEDMVALISLYRPSPIESGMTEEFIENKHKKNNYLHPILNKILKDTYGTIIYQEQVIKILKEFIGCSFGKADIIRCAMNKKNNIIIEEQKPIFINGATEKGMSKDVAENLFNKILSVSQYCFLKSHSIVYSLIAYQTAYLKYYYNNEYTEISQLSGL